MKRLAEVTAQEDLDWTIFRVPFLDPALKDPNLKVEAGFIDENYHGSVRLGRPSQAKWVLDEIQERKWIKGAPQLGNSFA
jgi:hypothetical protein